MKVNNVGINQDKTQEANRSLVIRLLQKKGPCSRAELARLTQLTQATITNIVSELIRNELVEEIGFDSNEMPGRRSILLKIRGERFCVIAIKIARTRYTVGVFNLSGRELEHKTMEVKDVMTPQDILLDIKAKADDYRGRYSRILAVGIAVPGPYLKSTGKIAMITEARCWNNLDIPAAFSELFTEPVFVEHDANAGAMANWWFGDFPQDVKVLCHMLLSEGVGVGVVENGELVLGQQGTAGEIGHVSVNVDGPLCQCGNRGCLELYCSAIALKKNVLANLHAFPESSLACLSNISYADIFKAMNEGDQLAIDMVEQCARYIGYGIVNIVNAYNPGLIVLSDIMTQGGKRMLDIVKATAKERILPELYEGLTICYSRGTTDAVLAGAAAIATDHIIREPRQYLLK